MSKKTIVIIDGPSGVGKDTIISELITRYPDRFARPINATTRAMRENESQGNPYLFLSEEEFLKLRESGEIFEHTIRHGTYRGMRKASFDSILNSGKIPVRDVDRFGLEAIKKVFGDICLSIFLIAPKDEIRKRMIERGEHEDSMIARLKDYDEFIANAKYYDYTIENIDKEETINKIMELINNSIK